MTPDNGTYPFKPRRIGSKSGPTNCLICDNGITFLAVKRGGCWILEYWWNADPGPRGRGRWPIEFRTLRDAMARATTLAMTTTESRNPA